MTRCRGAFITFEGPDGAGKTSQARLLAESLRARGLEVILTREPGGTEIGDQIRAVLHDLKNTAMHPRTEVLLFSASRAQHVEEKIRPALERGAVVISDRYYHSTLAYQGYGHGLDLDALEALTAFATGGLEPDMIIYIDICAEEGLRRRKLAAGAGEEWNRMDAYALAFHERVCEGYHVLRARDPGRWLYIDGNASMGEVQARIAAGLDSRWNDLLEE
jgi:dTMP kinase